jgi:hypothetical protein
MKIVKLFLIGFSLLCLSGCGGVYYQPSTSQPFEEIREFSSKNSATLINGQPSTEKVFFAGQRYANLNAWTDVAISIAERELTKRGLSVVKDAPKSLTMSIESAKVESGWVMITSQIVMRVKTSDGYSATYTGEDRSGMVGNLFRQMDTALMRVVVNMLNDPQIISFLTK